MSREDMAFESIMGAIVGDAVGVPYEFDSRERRDICPARGMIGNGTHNQPLGTWSDDSSLILCQMMSIRNQKRINYKDQAKYFQDWLYRGHFTPYGSVFDVGGTTAAAIDRLSKLKDPTKAGGKSEHSQGNGSLMRILPAAIYLSHEKQETRSEIIRKCSSMTHAHEVCLLCCEMYAEIISSMFTGPRWVSYGHKVAIQRMKGKIKGGKYETVFKNLLNPDLPSLPESKIRGSGWVVECLEAALWCSIRSTSYQDGILKAVNLGEDTDTTACVTGGLLGAQYHFPLSIPREWKMNIAREENISHWIDKFVDVCMEKWTDPKSPVKFCEIR